MKEHFRDWNFRGNISINYKDGSGNRNNWTHSQEQLLNQIDSIVEAYSAQDIKLTCRQLYYQLVASGFIPNADEVYKRICTFLTDARYAGLVDWESIEDRGRVPERHSQWDNIKSLIHSAVSQYRLPRWSDQDYYVELYCEKQAMESILKPVADKYHIYFGYNKGYSGAAPMYDLAKRCQEQIQAGKKVRVIYLGDHDSSGLDMIRDIHVRICEFLIAGDETTDILGDDDDNPNFQVIPLALNMEQINKYKPPPNPAKITDPRAKKYILQHGNKSWELDALKPEVLVQITEKGILEFLDMEKYNKWIALEGIQKHALEDFGRKLDNKKG